MNEWKSQFKYICWMVISVCAVFVTYFIFKFFSSPKDKPSEIPIQIEAKLQERVNQAQETALIEKTKAKLNAEEANKALNEILIIDNGAERRKRLAELLSQSQ